MSKPRVVISFDNNNALLAAYHEGLDGGRAFASGDYGLIGGDECDLILVHPETGNSLELAASVEKVTGLGADLRFGVTPFVGKQLQAFVGKSAPPVTLHERIRNLGAQEIRKVASGSSLDERVTLERVYGKAVWEPLLRNPKLSVGEVVRLARMGSLPKPLLELIVQNNAWVRVPQVRRALLANSRLEPAMLTRILKLMPPAELRLLPRQTSYPLLVRNAASKLIKR